MIAQPDILLLAGPDVAQAFEARLTPQRVRHCTEPYEALDQLARRTWPTVVLAAEAADLPGLSRACRRLQGASGRVLAVCAPADEPAVRHLLGGGLDDYLVFPPTEADWAQLARPRAATAKSISTVTPAVLADLVQAARAAVSLEACLHAMLSRAAGVALAWTDWTGKAPPPTALVHWAGPPARALVPVDPEAAVPAAARDLAGHIQACLPALRESARRTESLHRLAVTDHLTGAYNRRYFYYITNHVLLRATRRKVHVTLLLYDIDNFKRYNDTYGHAAGDEILRATAGLMGAITREQDIVARIGGDEFAVLFRDAELRSPNSRPPETAWALADRFRRAVHSHEFPCLGPEATGVLTISGGLASFPRDGTTCQSLLRKADQGLQEAKESGKNAVHLVGGPNGTPRPRKKTS